MRVRHGVVEEHGSAAVGNDALVGRSRDLQALQRLLDATGEDPAVGPTVAVVGVSGIGKTRLLDELAHRAERGGFVVHVGRGSELEQEVPFGLVIEALDDAVSRLDAEAWERLGPQTLTELGAILPSLTQEPPTAEPATALEAERFRCYHAVRDLLDELSRDQRLLLVLDDAHWADQATVELVSYLLRRPPRRCMIALAYRRPAPALLEGAVARAAREGGLHVLELGPLLASESAEMLGPGLSWSTRQLLYAESGGNPFYLRQLARAYRDRRSPPPLEPPSGRSWPPVPRPGVRLGRRGQAADEPPSPEPEHEQGAATTGPDLGVDIPAAVRATIVDELTRLSPAARTFAHAAALVGDPFDPDLVAEIAELPAGLSAEVEPAGTDSGTNGANGDSDRADLPPALAELVAAETVGPAERPGRFRFRHPLVRRAVYGEADEAWRREAHRRAARALARREAPLGQQAHHVAQSNVAVGDDAAVDLLVRAGEEAASRAPASAARWFTAALRFVPDEDTERRLSLLIALSHARGAVGRMQDSRAALAEAQELLPEEDTPESREVAVMAARVDQRLGRRENARPVMGDVIDVARAATAPDTREAGELTLAQAKNHAMLGHWEDAAREADAAQDLAAALDHPDLVVASSAVSASLGAWAAIKDVAELQATVDRLGTEVDGTADADMDLVRLEALVYLVFAEIAAERWAAAAAHAERGTRISRTSGHGFLYLNFRRPLVMIRLLQGRLPEARQVSDSVMDTTHLMDDDQALVFAEATHCWVAAQQGQMNVAFAAGANAVEAAVRSPDTQLSWMAHVCFGTALVEAEQYEQGRLRILEAGGPELSDVPPAARPHWLRTLAIAELACGRLDEGDAMATRAEQIAARLDLPMRVGDARHARAAVQLAQGDFRLAAATAAEAVAAYDRAGIPLDAARSRLLRSKALRYQGDNQSAGIELDRAQDFFDACGAVHLAHRTAREMQKLGVRARRKPIKAPAAPRMAASLSNREREVATLVARGYTNPQVAEALRISRPSVESHLAHVFAKLGVTSRSALAAALDSAG